MKILLVANDVSPSKTLLLLGEELSDRGHSVKTYCNDGKKDPMPIDIVKAWVPYHDVVICGISHPAERAKLEIAVAEHARDLGVPFGYWSDTFGCFARSQVAHLREPASFVFCVNDTEAGKARKLFPHAATFGTGSPLWEEFFTPKVSREAARQKLGKLGVGPETKVILSPGSKSLMVNILLWGCLVEAVSISPKPELSNILVLLSQHPGDNNPLDAYTELVNCSPVPARFIGKGEVKTSEILPAADLVVEFASSVGIEAACQRIPVVNFFMETLLKQRGIRGWDLCDAGASYEVRGDTRVLRRLIDTALSPFELLRGAQANAFPQPPEGTKGAAVKAMADALEHTVAIKAQHMVK